MDSTIKTSLSRYRFLRHFIKGVLSIYYRSIESYGVNFVPKRGRTLIIANHQAGLIDGILILATNKQVIRTLIKHTLWNNPIVAYFATGLGMIPVFRKQDLKPEEMNKPNAKDRHKESFSRFEDAMTANENVLIFPEGVSHDNSYVLKLRSGAARMILQTEAKFDFRVGISWLPCSIDLEVKDKPGGRVVIHYHPPRRVDKYRDLYVHDSEAAIQALKKEMEDYLLDITLSYSSWDDRVFIERLMEIWLSRAPNELLLDRHNQLLKWKRILENNYVFPEEKSDWENLRKKVNKIHHTLELSNLSIKAVFQDVSQQEHKKMAARILPSLLFWLPLMVVGYVFWWVPSKIIIILTAKLTKGHRDIVATYHVVGSFIFYPIWFLIFWFTAPWFYPPEWVVIAGAFFIFSGYSILNAARKVRIGFRELLKLYKYGSLQKMLFDLRSEVHQVWSIGARLWNRALVRQDDFDPSAFSNNQK
jgi:1-acyl-sn-glycerol-3-phosphate acyltransferase